MYILKFYLCYTVVVNFGGASSSLSVPHSPTGGGAGTVHAQAVRPTGCPQTDLATHGLWRAVIWPAQPASEWDLVLPVSTSVLQWVTWATISTQKWCKIQVLKLWLQHKCVLCWLAVLRGCGAGWVCCKGRGLAVYGQGHTGFSWTPTQLTARAEPLPLPLPNLASFGTKFLTYLS